MKLTESKSTRNQNGIVVFAGTDTETSILFNYLKAGKTIETFIDDYPQVTLQQVLDVLELADNLFKTIISD